MRRFLLLLAGLAAALTVTAAPAAAAATATATTCVAAAKATYRHTFNGAAGTLTVTATHPLCSGRSQPVSLVSYTTGGPGSPAGQFVYDTARATLSATHRSVTLEVAVPTCYTQIDAFFGTAVQTETTSPDAPYGTAKLGSSAGTGSRSTGALTWYSGGSTACTAAPRATFTNACDGTFTATLTNAGAASTQAVFLTGSRRIRLAPGRTTTIKVAKGKTLTIRDNTFTTYVATWRTPTTACTTTAPAPAPARPTTSRPSTATPTTASPSASPSASSSPTPTYADAPVSYPRFSSTTSPTALAQTGRGIGSVIAIGIGLLLIGIGIAAIAYLVRLNRTPI